VSAPLLLRDLEAGPSGGGPRALLLAGGRIAAIDEDAEAAAGEAHAVSAPGRFAAPGFIDLQVNGIGGHDFTTDPGSMWTVGRLMARHGVTAFLPAIVTSPRGTVEAALRAFDERRDAGGAKPLGLHVEGPFLAPARAGAHDPALLREPDLDEIRGWLASGSLRILTLAPELPGAIDAIRAAAAGSVVSIGHTDADAAMAERAIEAGARYATHLFNAMPPLSHRAPGVVGAVLADDRVTLGLIVDGRHLDPLVVGLVSRLAPDRVSLVSDAIAALGLADGTHRLGGSTVTVTGGAASLADGTIAGSVAALDAGVRRFAQATGSAAAAIEAATGVPARLLGLEDRGVLGVGCRADIVLLDAELEVAATLVGGDVVYDADGRWA